MLVPGAKLGEFELIEPLSTGGMGAVYSARQASTGRLCAVKVLLPALQRDDDVRVRFKQEAAACADIASEHVLKVIGYGVDAATDTQWIAMELLSGRTLFDLVVERRGLPLDQVIAICQQLFHGVAAAHAAGVVHRDLKPQNVVVANSQRPDVPFTVKVIDFGISKRIDGEPQQTLAMGTYAWMAPEQDSSRSIVDLRTDVWALGLVVFWLLTGRYFWIHANGPRDLLQQELHDSPIPSASKRMAVFGNEPLGAAFDTWFAGCVTRDPAERFPDAGTAWTRLAPVLDELRRREPALCKTELQSVDTNSQRSTRTAVAVDAAEHSTQMVQAEPVAPRGRNWGLFAGGAVALGVVGLAGYRFTPSSSTSVGANPESVVTVVERSSASTPSALAPRDLTPSVLASSTNVPMPTAPLSKDATSRAHPVVGKSTDVSTAGAASLLVVPLPTGSAPVLAPSTVKQVSTAGDAPSEQRVFIYAERKTGLVAIGPDTPLLSGDTYAFYVEAASSNYVAIYQLDAANVVTRLYPPKLADYPDARDLRVPAHQLVRVPPLAEGDLRVDAELGTERLVFVQSMGPLLTVSDGVIARQLRDTPGWPSNWSARLEQPHRGTAATHTVKVRGTWFAPRKTAAPDAVTSAVLLAATFFEIQHVE